ncbi:hypothetical protein EXQ31_07450 [Clostridium botulinum]|uniref:hypothetical protein n=1 Tax=Clostridium botulinum TaxID=1491 RepID=UPI001A91BBDE|nr:hypothetical protein [Clostridium botulinum]MBO0525306.1 hypothetical protein [Clostridium botulinum]MBO0527480.1 hypothetical protein [Clostridium botulinum]MBO0533566.1 hypothetical protein [Clostridium botulinum]MBO0535430.1 hypothetical protein [Clostridium botulinum]MBO0537978.1 hypothetical protein [Clostridium botulinum]
MRVVTTKNYIEIINFRHFFKHFVFTSEGDNIRNKQLKKYINVSVVIDMECGNTIELEKRDIMKNINENHLLFYEKKQVIFIFSQKVY